MGKPFFLSELLNMGSVVILGFISENKARKKVILRSDSNQQGDWN